ncbi:jmjC domain-containing protein 4 [Pyrus ussuriensis x Pyrus communis]|uniref:JmjC domain-containing protein 4 n=1 Tax=Pyrus ussuriensis x Pyrus communis TaxID=2448454 RepID=A0A5N5I4J0_9ROSA|nr:jmjC domain-containing protein 4 [Pyrus ussuriensis x Pyrus communis]
MGIQIEGQIGKVNGKKLGYNEFVEGYMEKNQPVMLTGLMDDWRACRGWVTDNGLSSLQIFATHFGKSKVQFVIADCGTREFTDQKRTKMTVADFVEKWLGDSMQEHSEASGHEKNNEISCSDYRFVYMGAKGYRILTPLHADVFSCVYNISGDVSETTVPGFSKAIWLERIQEPNEIIFVLSGWYHQVHNLEDRISINHNWFNAYNLHRMEYYEAREYIEDIKDICDLKVSANATLPLIQNFTFNLATVQKVASNIKSVEDLTGSHGFHLDFRETLTDPEFFKLNTDLGSIYGMVHMQPDWNLNRTLSSKKAWLDDMRDMDIVGTCRSQVCTAKGLVKFIEHAVAEFMDV